MALAAAALGLGLLLHCIGCAQTTQIKNLCYYATIILHLCYYVTIIAIETFRLTRRRSQSLCRATECRSRPYTVIVAPKTKNTIRNRCWKLCGIATVRCASMGRANAPHRLMAHVYNLTIRISELELQCAEIIYRGSTDVPNANGTRQKDVSPAYHPTATIKQLWKHRRTCAT